MLPCPRCGAERLIEVEIDTSECDAECDARYSYATYTPLVEVADGHVQGSVDYESDVVEPVEQFVRYYRCDACQAHWQKEGDLVRALVEPLVLGWLDDVVRAYGGAR